MLEDLKALPEVLGKATELVKQLNGGLTILTNAGLKFEGAFTVKDILDLVHAFVQSPAQPKA